MQCRRRVDRATSQKGCMRPAVRRGLKLEVDQREGSEFLFFRLKLPWAGFGAA
jgi:hypothetical protein